MQMRYVLLCVFAALTFAQGRPFDVETLLRIQRIGDPALSPDGRLVAYTVATPDLDKNGAGVWRRAAIAHAGWHYQRTSSLVA